MKRPMEQEMISYGYSGGITYSNLLTYLKCMCYTPQKNTCTRRRWSAVGERRYMARKNKYNARKTTIDGHTFDSMREAKRYRELKDMVNAGTIKHLKLQPAFPLQEGFLCKGDKYQPITYKADFAYTDEHGVYVVEDVKGMQTKEFMIKKKLFLYKYGEQCDFRIIK